MFNTPHIQVCDAVVISHGWDVLFVHCFWGANEAQP